MQAYLPAYASWRPRGHCRLPTTKGTVLTAYAHPQSSGRGPARMLTRSSGLIILSRSRALLWLGLWRRPSHLRVILPVALHSVTTFYCPFTHTHTHTHYLRYPFTPLFCRPHALLLTHARYQLPHLSLPATYTAAHLPPALRLITHTTFHLHTLPVAGS